MEKTVIELVYFPWILLLDGVWYLCWSL